MGPTDPLLDVYRPLVRSGGLVLAVCVVGVLGYKLLGGPEYGWLDALYMTTITLTTVGYGEIIDLSDNPAGRLFTVLLLVSGVGSFLSFVSTLTAFLVEGSAHHLLWRRRMRASVNRQRDHVVVCGGGNTGAHIVQELIETDRPFVLIEEDEERARLLVQRLGTEFPIVIGDATSDEALLEAGIERASCVVACVSSDKDNLIVTVSTRILAASDVRIVCRCIDERMAPKIAKAGADAVVSPNRIGGLRMISEAVRPRAVTYLDLMLRDKERKLRVEATRIAPGSRLDGLAIAELDSHAADGLLVLAIETGDGWQFAPKGARQLVADENLIYMGGPEVRRTVEALAG